MKKFSSKQSKIAFYIISGLMIISILMTSIGTTTSHAAGVSSYKTNLYNVENYVKITKNNAPLRTVAKSTGSVYMQLSKNSLLRINGSIKNSVGNVWHKVLLGGKTYYIYSENTAKNCNSIAVASLLKVTKNNAALRTGPYDSSSYIVRIPKNTILQSVGTVKNSKGNTWFQIRLQEDNNIYYIYSGNVSTYTTTSDMRIDMKVYFQSKNYSCSAAAPLAIIRWYNTGLNVSDVQLLKTTNYTVGGIEKALDKYLGNSEYRYNTFKTMSSYEKAIRNSLAQGSPVIARVQFKPNMYFNFKTNGHYTVITGIYKKNGQTWLELKDSFANRNNSNAFTDRVSGTVHIPLSTLYNYGSYGGNSAIYLIYNP